MKNIAELTVAERLNWLREEKGMSEADIAAITCGGLDVEKADQMIEQVVGTYALPYSIAPGFVINGKEIDVPMVGEEPYVVTTTTKGAALAAANGGITATNSGPIMIGQVQMTGIANPETACLKIVENKNRIIDAANKVDPVLISFGGGVKDVEARPIQTIVGPMVVVHLIIDVRDAMGAQAINAMVEAAAPILREVTGGQSGIKVLSNLAVYRTACARVTIRKEDLGGEQNVDKIVSACAFANADPFRAATNNKGVMNGIIPVVVATGNDTRAVESGVHAYASMSGSYKSITTWEKNNNGDLEGMIKVPMAVGIVGGTTRKHPGAQASLRLMGIKSAVELEEVLVSVGLATNLGTLQSLVTVGLHADFEAARK